MASSEPGESADGGRVALVIGNGAYQHGAPLANPVNDATAIAASLERLGFSPVTLLKNATLKQQGNALADFGMLAQKSQMAVIYFAGHGMEVDGENFLLPVDAELDHVKRLKVETVRLSDVLDEVGGAKRFRLVILDACRDNPFRGRMRGIELTRSLGQGLAYVEPQGNTLVAYAARHGTQAKDGQAGQHSPYANALLKHIETPNVDVRIIFGRIRDEVLQNTEDYQEPHIYGTMGGREVYLKTAPLAAVPAPISAVESSELVRGLQEERDWEKAQREHTIESYEKFRTAWIDGRFVEEAQRKIDEINETQDFKGAKDVAGLEAFLRSWPSGQFADEAGARIKSLKADAAWNGGVAGMLKMSALDDKFDAALLRSFAADFPDDKRGAGIATKLAEAEKAQGDAMGWSHSPKVYQRYLRNWPDGSKRLEAERLLAGGGDDRMWIEVQSKKTTEIVKRYLAEWPEGRHKADAQKLLGQYETSDKAAAWAGAGFGLAVIAAMLAGAIFILSQIVPDVYNNAGSYFTRIREAIVWLIDPNPRPTPPVVGNPSSDLNRGLGSNIVEEYANRLRSNSGSSSLSTSPLSKYSDGLPTIPHESTIDVVKAPAATGLVAPGLGADSTPKPTTPWPTLGELINKWSVHRDPVTGANTFSKQNWPTVPNSFSRDWLSASPAIPSEKTATPSAEPSTTTTIAPTTPAGSSTNIHPSDLFQLNGDPQSDDPKNGSDNSAAAPAAPETSTAPAP